MDPILEIESSDILDKFDLEDIRLLIESQVLPDGNDGEIGLASASDLFKPLYLNYAKIYREPDIGDEVKDEIRYRFTDICAIFIRTICRKFGIEPNEDHLPNDPDDLAGVVLQLYDFFVLRLGDHLEFILTDYILKNADALYATFAEIKDAKDIALLATRYSLPEKYALLVANIHSVIVVAFEAFTSNEDFFDFVDPDYPMRDSLEDLFARMIIVGDFAEGLKSVYEKSYFLRGNIPFNIIATIKEKYTIER